jgi:hypothetical protein
VCARKTILEHLFLFLSTDRVRMVAYRSIRAVELSVRNDENNKKKKKTITKTGAGLERLHRSSNTLTAAQSFRGTALV